MNLRAASAGRSVALPWFVPLRQLPRALRGMTAVSCLALAACGGGGGGGSGGTVTTVGAPDPVTLPPPSSTPVSASETAANYGVAQIGATTAYTAGARGAGVKVAVIDSGIALNHPEFAGRIDRNASIDIVTGNASTLEDQSGHGSHVAGVIAANVNGSGMRGIAPEAQLLVIRADLRDSSICNTPGCGYFDSDVANGLNYARRQNAHVVNLSIGKDGAIESGYRSAIEAAVRSGMLVVAAAGNSTDDQPLAPARFAGASGIAGGMLVVGAVDRNNAIYAQTSQAGSVADYFLVAPGVDIYSAYRDGGFARLTGTSMATPHVTGAAAALKSAFPSLSMQQVAAILLQTATDLGAPGTDPIYGRGLVNLAQALQPIGQPQLALGDTVDGERVSVASSRLSLGAAFGDALAGAPALAQAMALDDFDRPFAADLEGAIRRPHGRIDLDALLIDRRVAHDLPIGAAPSIGLAGTLGIAENRGPIADDPSRSSFFTATEARRQDFERLAVTSFDQSFGNLEGGLGLIPSEIEGGLASRPMDGLFLDADRLVAPADSLIDRGAGLRLSVPLAYSSRLHLGLLESEALRTEPAASENDRPGQMLTIGTEHHLGSATNLLLRYTHVSESDGLLGSTGSGAFAVAEGAVTQLATARLGYAATETLKVFAQATFGVSQLNGDMGLVDGWSAVRSDSFALGLTAADLMYDGDLFGVVFGQPLRVAAASARLDVPVGRDLEGRVVRRSERVDMTPSGRELRLELAYRRPLDDDQTLGTWLLLQHEPGHDGDAEPVAGIGLRWTRRL